MAIQFIRIIVKLYQDSNIFLGKLIVTTFANLASLFVWSLDLGECEDQEALQRRLSVKSGSILTGWSLRALVLSNVGTGFSVPQGLFLHVLALSALGPNPFYFLSSTVPLAGPLFRVLSSYFCSPNKEGIVMLSV